MKTRLLRKLRRQIPIYFSHEKEVIHTEKQRPIEGRYVVKNRVKKMNYYARTLEGARVLRREAILDEIMQRRFNEGKLLTVIEK